MYKRHSFHKIECESYLFFVIQTKAQAILLKTKQQDILTININQSGKAMKLILLLSLVIVASSSTASDLIGSACTNSIGIIKSSAGPAILSLAAGYFGGNLKMNISLNGYKRGNYINLFNELKTAIQYSGSYQDSGKVLEHGGYIIKTGQSTTWMFVKSTFSLAGSNGVIVWDLPKNKSLLIFYQNPLFGYNFAGICLIDQKPLRINSQMKILYDHYYNTYKKGPKQCAFGDNNQIKMVPYFQKLNVSDSDFSIKFSVRYELVEGEQPHNCYIQKLDINIGTK